MLVSAWSLFQITVGFGLASLTFFALHRYRKHRQSRLETELTRTLRQIHVRQQHIKPRTVPLSEPTSPPPEFRKDRGLVFPSFEGTAVPEQPISVGVAPTLISIPSLDSQPFEDSGEIDDNLGHRYSAVWNMAEEGNDLESISKATGFLIGEVELILGLMRAIQNTATRGKQPPKDSRS